MITRNRKAVLFGIGIIALVGTACRPSSEIRPPFVKESALPENSLSGSIVFSGRSDGTDSLFEMTASGGQASKLSAGGAEERSPVYSPDGSKIVFAATSEDGVSGIYVRSASGGSARAVVEGDGYYDYPAFSPDGSKIAYAHATGPTGNWDLFVIDANGKHDTQLTTDPAQDWGASWSPDGARLAFTSDRDGSSDIWIVDLASGTERNVVSSEAHDEQPAWSPDGTKIAFTSDRELERWQIFVHDVAAGTDSIVIRSDSMDRYPTWSPDGKYLLVSVGYLAVYNADGSKFDDGADRWKLSDQLGLSSSWTA
jgi:Tol biopolymer transport system component